MAKKYFTLAVVLLGMFTGMGLAQDQVTVQLMGQGGGFSSMDIAMGQSLFSWNNLESSALPGVIPFEKPQGNTRAGWDEPGQSALFGPSGDLAIGIIRFTGRLMGNILMQLPQFPHLPNIPCTFSCAMGGPNGGGDEAPRTPHDTPAWRSKVGEAMAKIDTIRGKTRAELGFGRGDFPGEQWIDQNGNHFLPELWDLSRGSGPLSENAGNALVEFVESGGTKSIQQVIRADANLKDYFIAKAAMKDNYKWALGIEWALKKVNGVESGLYYGKFGPKP